jgi:hypothetical protein
MLWYFERGFMDQNFQRQLYELCRERMRLMRH